MEEKNPDHIARPGVPEALDPALGNASLWETNPHDFNLKAVDPLHQMDNLLLDDATKQKIINQWNGSNEKDADENTSLSLRENNNPESLYDEGPNQIIARTNVENTMEVEWAEDEIVPEAESEVPPTPIPEDIHDTIEPEGEAKTNPQPGKVGKRVRKLVKKAYDEALAVPDPDQQDLETGSSDESLSPYTRWLKGLKGSEYVHPYDDDYGLDQMSSMARGGVSETFADLLAAQGYKDKAIEMYLQLMEKYPEKSSFFAAKIEALK
ncbi:MAG: hypothetical protein IPP15_03720 [Saprospiraceae bacterium]|uniref:Uncharacterized protein n=1 Tax=Candidatus Opimibacter skivensis TaxID=2982028 RepID=A0A9D7SSN7_9BACT|nr:hypothetical protein [Candidatus Opimibacter skivensis]